MYTVAFTAILSTMIKQNVMGFTTDRALKYFCMFFTIHTETCHGMMVPWIMDVKIIIDDRVFRTTRTTIYSSVTRNGFITTAVAVIFIWCISAMITAHTSPYYISILGGIALHRFDIWIIGF